MTKPLVAKEALKSLMKSWFHYPQDTSNKKFSLIEGPADNIKASIKSLVDVRSKYLKNILKEAV